MASTLDLREHDPPSKASRALQAREDRTYKDTTSSCLRGRDSSWCTMALGGRVAVFWDYENVRVPSTVAGIAVAGNIRDVARSYGPVNLFRAYTDLDEMASVKSNAHRSALQMSGVTLVDCPHNGRKDVADKMMIVDMLAFAFESPAPATIVLISGDCDFSYAVSTLRLKGHEVILIAPKAASWSIKSVSSLVLDWDRDVLGRAAKTPSVPCGCRSRTNSSVSVSPDSVNSLVEREVDIVAMLQQLRKAGFGMMAREPTAPAATEIVPSGADLSLCTPITLNKVGIDGLGQSVDPGTVQKHSLEDSSPAMPTMSETAVRDVTSASYSTSSPREVPSITSRGSSVVPSLEGFRNSRTPSEVEIGRESVGVAVDAVSVSTDVSQPAPSDEDQQRWSTASLAVDTAPGPALTVPNSPEAPFTFAMLPTPNVVSPDLPTNVEVPKVASTKLPAPPLSLSVTAPPISADAAAPSPEFAAAAALTSGMTSTLPTSLPPERSPVALPVISLPAFLPPASTTPQTSRHDADSQSDFKLDRSVLVKSLFTGSPGAEQDPAPTAVAALAPAGTASAPVGPSNAISAPTAVRVTIPTQARLASTPVVPSNKPPAPGNSHVLPTEYKILVKWLQDGRRAGEYPRRWTLGYSHYWNIKGVRQQIGTKKFKQHMLDAAAAGIIWVGGDFNNSSEIYLEEQWHGFEF